MKVLHVHTDLLGGGVEAVITTLALATEGAEVGICWCPANHPEPPAEFTADLERRGIRLFRILPPFLSPRYPWRLARVIRAFGPDVLHLHGSTVGVIGGMVGRLLGVPAIVYTEHVRHALLPKWLRRARELTANLPHWTVFVSHHLRREAIEEPGRLRSVAQRSSVIHNGIDLSPYRELEPATQSDGCGSECALLGPECDKKARVRAEVRAEIGLSPDSVAIGCVGLLWFAKGQEFLLRALPLIERELAPRKETGKQGAHLTFVGSGEDEPKLRRLSQEIGVADRVFFLGWRSDIHRILCGFDIYVQPSISEGLVLSLIEASAAGLPIVASRVGGVPEIVRDGIDGLLVPPRDVEALAAAVVELLYDPVRARQLAASARERAFTLFSAEAMAQAYKKLYSDLLAGERNSQ